MGGWRCPIWRWRPPSCGNDNAGSGLKYCQEFLYRFDVYRRSNCNTGATVSYDPSEPSRRAGPLGSGRIGGNRDQPGIKAAKKRDDIVDATRKEDENAVSWRGQPTKIACRRPGAFVQLRVCEANRLVPGIGEAANRNSAWLTPNVILQNVNEGRECLVRSVHYVLPILRGY
ncbi:MAG: hypothetical protein NTAFB05_08610 [Nitrobacter sp.]